MKTIRIEKQAWAAGLDKLRSGYELFGPVARKDAHEFRKLDPEQLPELEIANTRLSAKASVFPQSQVMFRYSLDTASDKSAFINAEGLDVKPKAVLGIKPCDAASFLLVKRNFDNPEYPDPYWIAAYEQTTLVGFACDLPQQTCFCTSVGGSPYGETGLDLLLTSDGDDYIGKSLTEKGDRLISTAGWEIEGEEKLFDEKKSAAEGRITTKLTTDQIRNGEVLELFNASFWDQMSFSCLNCGTCTFVCPTCWCFDIQDETNGKEGKRMRNWDSCMFPLFTLEGSGHNPRPQKTQRFRQRFMHKLKYYPDKYGSDVQCVGCGRCIHLCPVNIDIRNVCETMNNLMGNQTETAREVTSG